MGLLLVPRWAGASGYVLMQRAKARIPIARVVVVVDIERINQRSCMIYSALGFKRRCLQTTQ